MSELIQTLDLINKVAENMNMDDFSFAHWVFVPHECNVPRWAHIAVYAAVRFTEINLNLISLLLSDISLV